MSRNRRADFFEEIERIEQVLNQLLEAERDAFRRLIAAPAGPAKAAALRALELDDTLAEAHTSLAQITANYEWNWNKAESEYKKAIELNPNYATAYHWYSIYLKSTGRNDEARAAVGRGSRSSADSSARAGLREATQRRTVRSAPLRSSTCSPTAGS